MCARARACVCVCACACVCVCVCVLPRLFCFTNNYIERHRMIRKNTAPFAQSKCLGTAIGRAKTENTQTPSMFKLKGKYYDSPFFHLTKLQKEPRLLIPNVLHHTTPHKTVAPIRKIHAALRYSEVSESFSFILCLLVKTDIQELKVSYCSAITGLGLEPWKLM